MIRSQIIEELINIGQHIPGELVALTQKEVGAAKAASEILNSKGRWLGTEYDGYADGNPVYKTYTCSECGAEFECEDMDFEYCPRCGCMMELGDSK